MKHASQVFGFKAVKCLKVLKCISALCCQGLCGFVWAAIHNFRLKCLIMVDKSMLKSVDKMMARAEKNIHKLQNLSDSVDDLRSTQTWGSGFESFEVHLEKEQNRGQM